MTARLIIDWNKLVNDEPPAELVVDTKAPPTTAAAAGEENDELSELTVLELTRKINGIKSLLSSIGARLPDKGEKLKARLKKYEDEFERKLLLHSEKITSDKCGSLGRHHSGSIGAANDLGQWSPESAPLLQSAFAVCVENKLEEKARSKTASGFQNELHALNTCGRKRTLTGQSSPTRRLKTALPSRETPFKFPVKIDERGFYSDGKRRDSSTFSPRYSEGSFSSLFMKKWKPSQAHSAFTSRHANDKDVVLVDEEIHDVVDSRQQAYHVVEREDPEAVEIHYSDMGSLAPEAYLSSTIMNFYIQYLQQRKSPADGERCEYHFFNTYFYNKLKKANFSKCSLELDNNLHTRQRRPMGANNSSLGFVGAPLQQLSFWYYKKVRLTLSLAVKYGHACALHDLVLARFLKEEWKFLRQEAVPGLPIADKIWENLLGRIDDKIIEVPQQRNDFDCGLFVLFFMERFIIEFKERLKKEDLTKFGSKWFRPKEASGMRLIIHDILEEKFKNSIDECHL
ncbi:putative xyloglucan endotransglucosylase/hydrolase protein 33-like [Capsicum annuum]|nr:putative xyloglucan endotransglucosylase/hydrolase protein 33-like [Capsicum annuum]